MRDVDFVTQQQTTRGSCLRRSRFGKRPETGALLDSDYHCSAVVNTPGRLGGLCHSGARGCITALFCDKKGDYYY